MQIYVHVPFCKQKCRYCSFASSPCKADNDVSRYLTALNSEIDLAFSRLEKRNISTVYIGGGTPSLLSIKEFDEIVKSLSKYVDLKTLNEFTVECNPESISLEKLEYLKSVGVNRISIGVQSLNDENLKDIGRIHDSNTAISAVKLAIGIFDNVSVDFIVGLPHDDVESVCGEIDIFAPLVQHISVYTLQVEEGTPLEKLICEKKISVPDDDFVTDLYDAMRRKLSEYGFERYEISNFARDGKYSRHNVGYWTRAEYIGLGPGASSFLKTIPEKEEIRYTNEDSLEEYIQSVENATDYPFVETETLNAGDIKKERIMLGLRLSDGIEETALDEDMKSTIREKYEEFFVKKGGKIALNESGMNVSNVILSDLLF